MPFVSSLSILFLYSHLVCLPFMAARFRLHTLSGSSRQVTSSRPDPAGGRAVPAPPPPCPYMVLAWRPLWVAVTTSTAAAALLGSDGGGRLMHCARVSAESAGAVRPVLTPLSAPLQAPVGGRPGASSRPIDADPPPPHHPSLRSQTVTDQLCTVQSDSVAGTGKGQSCLAFPIQGLKLASFQGM